MFKRCSIPRSSIVNLAPMRNARNAYELRSVVDNVNQTPITDPDAPVIFVAFQLLASSRPWYISQRVQFSNNTRQQIIPKGLRVLSLPEVSPQRNTYPRNRPRLARSALIFSSGMPFPLRRDSEISPSQKSSKTAPYLFRSI